MDHTNVISAIMDSATQLLVADRHRAPKGQAREPLNAIDADGYVRDAGRLWLAADRLVKDSTSGSAGATTP